MEVTDDHSANFMFVSFFWQAEKICRKQNGVIEKTIYFLMDRNITLAVLFLLDKFPLRTLSKVPLLLQASPLIKTGFPEVDWLWQ